MPARVLPLHLRLALLFHCLSCGAGAGGLSWEHSRSSSMCSPSSARQALVPSQQQQQQQLQRENIFLRNCSSIDMHPPFLPTPAHIVALGHVLHNRTLAFIGDSTTQSQYEYLCLKLKGKNTRKKWKFPKNYFMVPSECPLPHLGALLTFQGAGQRFDWARLPPPAATLNSTMYRLGPSDVVVFNVGIHWHAGCQKGSDSGQKYVDVLSSIRAILTQAQHCKAKRKHSSGSGKRAREEEAEETVEGEGVSRTLSEQELGDRRRGATKFPLLIWRETLPQHFPSSNGGYPLNQRFVGDLVGLVPGEKLQCVEMTPERAAGQGLQQHGVCNPNCLSSTWQNDLANPVMLEQCVDIMHTYEDFRCLHKYHSGEDNWDCSHYQPELVHYLNWKLLQTVGRLSKRRARHGRRRAKLLLQGH